ncbi:hypothetical protein NDA10_006097 [Ustilago hordei]|nr:hypothetical protein NDA10_006097 [Ustilago hordei]
MDSYGLTCKGGPSTATRRTKLKEQAQPRGGPSSRSMQMVTTQGLERQEPKELSLIKGGGAVSKESTPGHEEEEQCRRSRHQVMRRRSCVDQEAQGCQAGEAPEQYSMKKVSGPDIDRTEGSSPLRSGDHFKHQVNTLDTRVDATNLITNTINLIVIDATNLITNTINLINIDITNLITNTINLIIINTHTRPWCHHNIDIDRAELPLNGVSTETDLGFRRETPDTIFLGYSLERRGWLFYSPDYSPNIFWSNSARFMETKCWSDRMEWRPVTTQSPPALANEENFDDLRYTDENLFDEREKEPLQEYMDMENIDETDQEQISNEVTKETIEHNPVADRWNNDKLSGFMAISDNKRKNMDPTVSEALSGEDKKHWEEVMCKELDRLKAMGMWEVTDLPKGMTTVDMCWVLKIKTDANLIPTKFKARLVAQGFTQREGIDYMEVFAPIAPIQSIQGVLAMATI